MEVSSLLTRVDSEFAAGQGYSVLGLFIMSYKVFAHENDMCLFEIYKSFVCGKNFMKL